MKRVIVVLLACALIAAPVCAAPLMPDQQVLAEFLYEMGLFKGTGRGFELEASLTREQSAVMLVRLLGKEDEALAGTYTTPFTDVKGWSVPYIGWLYENGITVGVAADRFAPRAIVTQEQYSRFLSRALGSDIDSAPRREFTPLTKKILTRGDAVEMTVQALSMRLKDHQLTLAQYMIGEGSIDESSLVNAAVPIWGDKWLYSEEGFLRRFDIDTVEDSGLWQEGSQLFRLVGGTKTLVDTGTDNEYPGWVCVGISGNTAYIFKLMDEKNAALLKLDLKTEKLSVIQSGLTVAVPASVELYSDHLNKGDYAYGAAYRNAYYEYVKSAYGVCTSCAFGESSVGFAGSAGLWHERGGRAYRLDENDMSAYALTLVTRRGVLYKNGGNHYYAGINGDRRSILRILAGSGFAENANILSYENGIVGFCIYTSAGEGHYTFTYEATDTGVKCIGWSYDEGAAEHVNGILKERGITVERLRNELINEEQRKLDAITE